MQIPVQPQDSEARLHYRDGTFDIVFPGSFVVCAVTGQRIPLERLRYWSVDRQEAYIDAAAALKRVPGAGQRG